MKRKSSRGNPWHDERGRFTHGPSGGRYWQHTHDKTDGQANGEYTESQKTEQEYETQTALRKALAEPTRKNAEEYLQCLKQNKDYSNALAECDRRADRYNEVAIPLEEKMVAYDDTIDEGKDPNCDCEELRRESEEARRRYEEYKEADAQAGKYEKDLREVNKRMAEAEGQKPTFFNGVTPRKKVAMVTMPYHAPHAQKGFSEDVTDRNSREYQMTLNEAAALRGETKEETERRFGEILCGKEPTVDNYKQAFEQLYKEKQGELLALDIETNSLSPAQGNIIEYGSVDSNGVEFNSLYSPTEAQMKANGVGMTEVHNISKSMVRGKKTFESDTENILSAMKGRTILVHNKGFELNWFRQQIPGFAEAERNGEIGVVDTMHICQKFCNTKRNRLMDFVEYTGGKYENAHRSSADARMTIDALNRWIKG